MDPLTSAGADGDGTMVQRAARWAPAAAALPVLVAVVVAVVHGWSPVSDQAGEISRIADVGTRHTPLVGPFSRSGWSHPGPLLFWVCAPGWRVFGSAGVLVTVGLVNAGAAAVAPVLARKVAGAAFAVAVTAVLLVVELSIGASGLVDVWNPYVGTIALATGVLGLAAVVRRSDWAVPVAVMALSWAVQSHVGPALTVAAAVLTAAAMLAHGRRVPRRRWLVVGLAVGALAWSGPVIDQATGDPGNLTAMVSDLSAPAEPPPSLKTSLGITASHLGLVPVWARGGGTFNRVAPIWTLAVPLAGLALTALSARRRRDAGMQVTAAITGASFVAAVVATTRIDLVMNTYLYRWTWAVGALTWAVIGTGAWRHVQERSFGRLLSRAAPPLVGVSLLVAVLGVSIAVVVDDDHVPLETQSVAAAELLGQLRGELPRDGSYVIVARGGPDFGGVATGLGVALSTEGYDVAFRSALGHQMGSHRIARDGDGRQRLEVLTTTTIEQGPPTAGARLLATHDPLTRTDRDRIAALEDEIRDQAQGAIAPDASINAAPPAGAALALVGADPETIDALDELTSRGHRYTVWLIP